MVNFGEPTDPDVVAAITLRPSSELSKVYVLADHHGSGVARELVEASAEVARVRGAAGFWLGVNQDNPRANRFYEKAGFALVGSKKFLLGGVWENDFVRERPL
jgi:ribosomal protein S18 acetylase RimI-like enzyme